MNFSGSKTQSITKFGSVCSWDNITQLPLGVARVARNVRYTAVSVATRYGYRKLLAFAGTNVGVGAFQVLRFLPPAGSNSVAEYARIIAYTRDGRFWDANPFVQSTVTQLPTPFGVQPNLNPIITQAFNKGIIALGDCTQGQQTPLIYDPSTRTLDQASDQPWGFTWTPNCPVRKNQVVSPVIYAGKVYQAQASGVSGPTEPAWPSAMSATVQDGSVLWEECTPIAISALPDPGPVLGISMLANPNSAIVSGATIFIALTYVNQQGESINELVLPTGRIDPGKVVSLQNTQAGNAQCSFQLPPIPAILATTGQLGPAFGATGYNVYAYIQTGRSDPAAYLDPTYYAQVGGTQGPGSFVTVQSFPIGNSLNQVNTAAVNPNDGAGAVDVGVRWMVPMFETRTGYFTGWNANIPIRINVTASGQRILILRVPRGPDNVIFRWFGFTVAGASAAGPYFYVYAGDVESPGFNQPDVTINATVLYDNVATVVQLNFTDTYLPGASEVTNYADRIQVPPCSDVYFSKTLGMVIYTGCVGYDHLVSDLNDPEAVRVPGSNLSVASSDGDRCVCWREVRDTQISLKENSAHAVIPNQGDPNTWNVQELWRGVGPVGPKAVDVFADDASAFMVFVHRSGPYLYDGSSAKHIGRELIGTPQSPGPWDRINWGAAAGIRVCIDGVLREARFFVPVDGSAINNLVLTLNFFHGWGDVQAVGMGGSPYANMNGRKWSVDDISAFDAQQVPQRYSTNPAQAGLDVGNHFITCGIDGSLYTIAPAYYADDRADGTQAGYLSQWISVPGPSPGRDFFSLLGGTVSAVGSGMLNVYAFDQGLVSRPLSTSARTMTLSTSETIRDFGAVGVMSTAWGIGFDNFSGIGTWFEVHLANLYLLPKFSSQIG